MNIGDTIPRRFVVKPKRQKEFINNVLVIAMNGLKML